MRLLIIILLALLVAIGLGSVLTRDTGFLLFSYADYDVQMSLSFFVLAMVLVFLLVYIIFRVLGGLLGLPKNFRRWSTHRRHRRSEKYLSQGLLAMLEGDWRSAEESFKRGATDSRLPLVNYLAAARAAQHEGAIQRRDHYLRLAHHDSPEAGLVVGLTQARLQLSQRQTEEAYATLKHLEPDGSGRDRVNALLLEAAIELREWPDALRIMNDPGNNKIMSADQLRARQLAVYAGLLREAGEMRDRSGLERIWEGIPRKLRTELFLIEEYVRARCHFPDTSDCEQLLRKTLKKRWDTALVGLYGEVGGSNIAKQIQFAERLLSTHPGEPELLLCLGRLCKRNSLWGKARTYLEEAMEIQASPQACHELALLLEQQGEHAAAATYYQKGLALATGIGEPEPVALLESLGNENAIVEGARKVV